MTSTGAIGDRSRAFVQNIVEQLIDLSRRNPSLNFRASKSTVPLAAQPQDIASQIGPEKSTSMTSLVGDFPTPDQQKALRRLADRSRLLYEERGVRTLHVAMGLLQWDDTDSGKTYNAPLMLLAVDLHRSGDTYSVQRSEGAEPEPNRALIELLRRHPVMRAPEIDQSDDLTYEHVVKAVRGAFPPTAVTTITDQCYLGLFSYDKLVMVLDIEVNAASILEHPVVAAMNGDPGPLALLQHGIEMPTPPDLDRATMTPDRVYVVESDSSQQEVLEAIARGLSIVVQGPPGTGKSQTIVNMIAQALFEGKSVLFVAEKKVALDVVFQRLAREGLADSILDVQRDTDKRRFARMLGLRHTEIVSSSTSKSDYRSVRSALEELDAYQRELHEPLAASEVIPFNLYGRQSKYVADTPPVRIERIETFDKDALERLGETLERVAAHPTWLRKPNEARWASLRPEIDDLGRIHEALEQMVDGARLADELSGITSESEALVGRVGPADGRGLTRLATLLGLLGDAPVVPESWILGDPQLAASELERYVRERGTYENDRSLLLNRYRPEVFDGDLGDVTARFLSSYEHFWNRWFNPAYASDVRNVLEWRLADQTKSAYREICSELQLLESVKERREAWTAPTHRLRNAFGRLFQGANSTTQELGSAVHWYQRFAEVRDHGPIDTNLVGHLCGEDGHVRHRAATLAARLSSVRAALDACGSRLNSLLLDLPEDQCKWAGYLKSLVDAMEEAPRYCQYRKWIAELRSAGFHKFLDAIASAVSIEPERWRWVFDRVVDASLIDYAHRTRSALASFDRESHELVRKRYADADRANVASGGRRVNARLVETARLAMANTSYREAVDVIMHEAKKLRNVMPVRALARRAFDAIRVLKPCWMMSPLAVSQYLPPGQVFDLIIFDEASQMRPADAIPALSRAKQIVVVGDDKQLPPTSFFDNTISGDDDAGTEQEAADLADYESILDRCGAVLQQRMLRWHYRSRHESLIAFSNHHFYDDRLVTFPTAGDDVRSGIRHVRVQSTYARGASRQNRGEAAEVVRLAHEHARSRPNETLGIVAFSQAQQRAIEDALEDATRQSPDVAEFFSEVRPASERVFVKNLESVQGDERDVMILSVGYGRDDEGRLSYNFGPLNRAGGGRRLNVAVTRARLQMIVVSSIDDRDLDAEKCREGGASLIRSYLGYARSGGTERGATVATGRGVDSPFEEDVRLVLSSAGHRVHIQVGASSYRIDLAVCHPEREGEYVLAVECDGATYHGTPTARDRDRLRDRTLETFGWRIHRIWSRDWFRRRSAEIERLLGAVEDAIATHDVEPPPAAAGTPSAPVMTASDQPDPGIKLAGLAETAIFNYLERNIGEHTKKAISDATSLPESLVTSALTALMLQRYVDRVGVGRGTKYMVATRRRR